MKVLHVISSPDLRGGGPLAVLIGMAQAQQRAAGLDVQIITTFYADERNDLAEKMAASRDVVVHSIGPATGTLKNHPQLRPAMQRLVGESDVVHIHGLYEQIQHEAALAARQSDKPYLITPHGMLSPWSLQRSRWKKKLYMFWRLREDLNAAAALHFSTATESRVSKLPGVRTPHLVVAQGVDWGSEFEQLPQRGRFRARFGQLVGKRVVVFLGRVFPGKGLEHLIPAIAMMKNKDAMLAVVGPDTRGYQAQMEAMAAAHGVTERVLFCGMQRGHERIEALVDADLLCLPSDHENFGLSVIEALAAGTPVIISPEVNVQAEICKAGVGATVERSPQRLALELDRWLDDDALRQAAAAKARPFVRENYDWNRIAGQWAEHYQRQMKSR